MYCDDFRVHACTAMISGYTEAWSVFVDMVKNQNVPPNAFTISSVLKACKGMNSVSYGGSVHGLAIKRRFVEGFIYVDNALVDMHATCGVTMRDACVVFAFRLLLELVLQSAQIFLADKYIRQ